MKLTTTPYLHKTIPLILSILLSVMTVKAQNEIVIVNHRNITVGEMVNTIKNQTKYLFVYDINTFDLTRAITLNDNSYLITEIMELMVKDTDYSYMIEENYIVINSMPKQKITKQDTVSRTDDVYVAGKTDDIYFTARPYTEVISKNNEPQVVTEESKPELPTPYSVYNNPDLYTPMSAKLPRIALKTNLLYGGVALAPNLAVEIGTGSRNSLEIFGGVNWKKHNSKNTKQLQHFIIRPEYRWWMCERYNGHFIGVHAFYAHYQISGRKVPMLFKKENRYDGDALGAGFTYGYNLILGKKWGLEFNVGVGAAYLKYDKFTCAACDRDAADKNKFYFGPTRAGVTLTFLIK